MKKLLASPSEGCIFVLVTYIISSTNKSAPYKSMAALEHILFHIRIGLTTLLLSPPPPLPLFTHIHLHTHIPPPPFFTPLCLLTPFFPPPPPPSSPTSLLRSPSHYFHLTCHFFNSEFQTLVSSQESNPEHSGWPFDDS